METKILKAVFGGGTSTVTNKRTRTDYGQVLEISGVDLPSTFECIFSNSDTSAGVGKKMIGSNQRVLIPDEYLATGQTIYAWVLVHDGEDDGRHMYSIRIPVADMPDTSPEEPTPVEQSIISQAITALNSAVDTTSQKAQEASASADRAEQAAEGAEGYAERAEAAQSASESARDRATQAETSARTSAATATEKASEAISSATTASQSAMTAENASESAQASATASAESAEQASQSADTASGKASDASEYAQEASGYASNSSTSAQTASQKASEAAQSASTAVQAKTDAETAKTASQTAQGLAETARDGAVTAKTSAEDARDEAQSIVDGITGKVEQIDSNTDRIESLEDDRYKPYPIDSVSGSIASFPDGADDIPLKSCIVQVEPVQEGSGDPSPDNVRPISGFTGINIYKAGQNLIPNDIPAHFYHVNPSAGQGAFVGSSNAYSTFIIPIPKGKICLARTTRNLISYGALCDELPTVGANAFGVITMSSRDYRIFDNSEGHKYFAITTNRSVEVNSDWDSFLNTEPRLTIGDDVQPYTAPTNISTYPITFPTEAGTVYGGYIDPINGELVVDRVILSVENMVFERWRKDLPVFMIACSPKALFVAGNINNKIANCLPTISNHLLYAGLAYGISEQNNGDIGIAVQGIDKTSDLVSWANSNNLQICYKLENPIHYPLTPTEIKTLLGQNNIWSDTGDVSVEYRADTRLYIEKLTQPEEDDMIADSAISEGQFFMVGNSLYRALANIASGATITVGTNAERVSLSDALNLVNA